MTETKQPRKAPPAAPAWSPEQLKELFRQALTDPAFAEEAREMMGASKLTTKEANPRASNADAALIVSRFGDVVRDEAKAPFEPVFPEGVEENPQARALALTAWRRGYQNGERGAFEKDDHPDLQNLSPELGGL